MGDDVARCPIEVVPDTVKDYLLQVAEFTQAPVDLALGQWLAAAAIAVQKKFVVEPSRGWQEQLSLYVVSVMEPANRKSAVVSAISAPIREFEAENLLTARPAIRAAHAKFEVNTKLRNRLVDSAAKAQAADREAILHDLQQLDEEMAAATVPAEPRLLADDITPEHLATKMSQNGGRMGVLTSEGDIFDIIGGRYSKSPNLGVVLKGHSGDEIRVDRGNRPSELIRRPALTMGLCAQPDVLKGIIAKGQFRGRGMMGRLLYQIPKSLLGTRKIATAEVDPLVEVSYRNTMWALLNLPAQEDPDGYVARSLTLSAGAEREFCVFREQIEKALLDFNSLYHLKDWGGKLPGAVARIAGLLHLISYTEYTEIPTVIEADVMKSAIALGQYFISHAQIAYRVMGQDANLELAEAILKVIEKRTWSSFTKRDAHQILRRQVDSPDDLDKPLEILVDHNFLRCDEPETRGKGRKPSPNYFVNPKYHIAIRLQHEGQ